MTRPSLFHSTDPDHFFQLQMAALKSGLPLELNTGKPFPAPTGMHEYSADDIAACFAETPPEQIAVSFQTSGSTGAPKTVRHSWRQLLGEAQNVTNSIGLRTDPNLLTITTVPLDHMFGFAFGFVLTNMLGFERPRKRVVSPRSLLSALQDASYPVVLITTPTHLKAYVGSGIEDFPNVAWIFCATSPLPSDLAPLVMEKFRTPIIDIYGCTEGGVLAYRKMSEPNPDWTCLQGTSVSAMEDKFVFETDYFDESVIIDDQLELTGANTFRFLGRSNDMVKIGGKRQSLSGLASQVETLPNVREAAFYFPSGNPNARLALFIAFDGSEEFEAIKRLIAEKADPVFVPRQCFAVDALPRTATGKLPISALAELYEQQTSKQTTGSLQNVRR